MHLFLCWRSMEDPIGALAQTIERILWGDSRARHTFLIACTEEHPLLMIEIDVGDRKKGIKKSMRLNIRDLDELPSNLLQVELIGETQRIDALDIILRAAENFVEENPDYNAALNNCRTFVEYIIDQIPEFIEKVPRKNGSILEYYHSKEKQEHPGALIKGKTLVREIRETYHKKKEYRTISQIKLPVAKAIANDDNL